MAGIGAILSIVGTGLSVVGQIQQNKAQSAVANYEAKAAIAKGKEERAAAQREALDKQEQTDFLLSKQRALAAASGAGLETPSVIDIYTKTAQRGEYQEQALRYGGESRQRGYEDKAAALRAGSGGDALGIVGGALAGLSKSGIFG
jgi:hypothetical protein